MARTIKCAQPNCHWCNHPAEECRAPHREADKNEQCWRREWPKQDRRPADGR